MESGALPKKINVTSEKPARYQLHRTYTLDFWNVEIDTCGKDTTDKLKNNKSKSLDDKQFKHVNVSSYRKKSSVQNEESNFNTKFKWLYFITIFVSAATITGLIIAIIQSKQNNEVCLSTACVKMAAAILENINEEVDPCQNFYDFACGNYGQDIKNDEWESSFTKGDYLVKNQLKAMFKKGLPKTATKLFEYLTNLYEICGYSNKSLIGKEMDTLKLLLDSLGGWPTIVGNEWNANSFDWVNISFHLRKLGLAFEMFLSLRMVADVEDRSKTQLIISPTKIHSLKAAIRQVFIGLAMRFKAKETHIMEDMNNITFFTQNFAKLEKRQSKIIKLTIGQLQSNYNKLHWLKFVNNIINTPKVNITEETVIQLELKSLQVLDLLLMTPKRTISNYIILYILTENMSYFRNTYKALFLVYPSNFDIVHKSLPVLLNSWYAKTYMDQETKHKITEMIEYIKNQLKIVIQNAEWLDKDTRSFALKKLDAMQAVVGYPENLVNETFLEYYYRKLNINYTTCFDAVRSINKFEFDKYYEVLNNNDEYLEHEDIEISVIEYNAFYMPTRNYIIIPVAYILNTNYDKNHPQYVNYATLGSIIGHEITHGFDENGRKFGTHGQLHNWWSPVTEKAFEEKAQCLVKQYQNLTMFNMSVNGNLTLCENIADNGGLKQAFRAYKTIIKDKGKQMNLPGLNFTPDQTFWVSYAQLWCEKISELYVNYLIQTDCHAPNRCRVIGTLSNTESFSKDFNCPLGAPMNPIKKCGVW